MTEYDVTYIITGVAVVVAGVAVDKVARKEARAYLDFLLRATS